MIIALLSLAACDSESASWSAPEIDAMNAASVASADEEMESAQPGGVPLEEPEPELAGEEIEEVPVCAAWDAPVRTGALPEGLEEVSGLVASHQNPGILWAIEDSGNDPEIYALTTHGTLVGVLHLDGVLNHDWEDLSLARCGDGACLWVGDVGDNDLARQQVSLLTMKEPVFDGEFDGAVQPIVYPFHYGSGPQNVESLVVTADSTPYVLTKRGDGTSVVYAVDVEAPGRDTEARVVTSLPTSAQGDDGGPAAIATGAAIWPDESRLMMRTYGHVWSWDLGADGIEGVGGAVRSEVRSVPEPQGEAIAWDGEAMGYYQTSEGEGAGIWFTGCAE